MLKSFFHTGFIVKDLEAAVAFYSDVLGLTLTMRTERTGEFRPPCWVSLMPTSRARSSKWATATNWS